MSSLVVEPLDSAAGLELLTHAQRCSPFCTPEYARALQALGNQVWIVGCERAGEPPEIALAAITRSRFGTVTLDMPSLPAAAEHDEFWAAVNVLCRKEHITDLSAGTFGSPAFTLPPLPGELARTPRQEHVISLETPNLISRLSSNHKRNIKKAQTAGVQIRRTRDQFEWLPLHTRLLGQSRDRRVNRGESVQISEAAAEYRAYLESGAGELFQAFRGSEVLSSVLVITGNQTAYYQTSGSSPEGMSVGSSHFLVFSILGIMQAAGFREFNLGGAPAGSSLARFKQGFGGCVVDLESAVGYIGPVWKRRLRTAVRTVRSDPKQLLPWLTGKSSRLLVYGMDTAGDIPTAELEGARLVRLGEDQLQSLQFPASDPDLRVRQLARVKRFGRSYAHAVFLGEEMAHISWLLPASAVAMETPQILQLRDDEAEITGCETLAEFRGKGVYAFAIQQLVAVARASGIRRIYMKTDEDNTSSQKGILKAGFAPVGSVDLVHPPLRPSVTVVRRNVSWPE